MNREEFKKIVPKLRPLMVKVGRDFFGNRDDAEDVAQDGLERLWNYCERLDASRNVENLAEMVAKNICVEKYRRRQMNVQVSTDLPAQESYEADASLHSDETAKQIDTALGTLSPREEQLVRKRFLEDKTADEISDETGIPKASVKSMISTAKAKLIKRLRR